MPDINLCGHMDHAQVLKKLNTLQNEGVSNKSQLPNESTKRKSTGHCHEVLEFAP